MMSETTQQGDDPHTTEADKTLTWALIAVTIPR
jgi:hypothetical protein